MFLHIRPPVAYVLHVIPGTQRRLAAIRALASLFDAHHMARACLPAFSSGPALRPIMTRALRHNLAAVNGLGTAGQMTLMTLNLRAISSHSSVGSAWLALPTLSSQQQALLDASIAGYLHTLSALHRPPAFTTSRQPESRRSSNLPYGTADRHAGWSFRTSCWGDVGAEQGFSRSQRCGSTLEGLPGPRQGWASSKAARVCPGKERGRGFRQPVSTTQPHSGV